MNGPDAVPKAVWRDAAMGPVVGLAMWVIGSQIGGPMMNGRWTCPWPDDGVSLLAHWLMSILLLAIAAIPVSSSARVWVVIGSSVGYAIAACMSLTAIAPTCMQDQEVMVPVWPYLPIAAFASVSGWMIGLVAHRHRSTASA